MKNIMKQKKTTITASMVIAMLVVTAMVISKLMGLSFADNTFTALNGKYIITSEKNMTAQYTGVSKNSVTSVNIPSTVEINGQMYKVTSIKANALKGNTKVKKMTIGSNVKTIGKKAFYGCKNLKTIAIKTSNLTSSSIKAGAFKGLNSKAVVTVPKEKLAAYKKILKVKGLTGKNQTIKGVKIETETEAEEAKKEEEELDPNRVIPEPKVGFGIENHFDFDVTDAENCKQGEYVTGDTISITAGFQMDDTMYGKWTTRTAPGGFWIRCNACGKMFDNQEDFNIQSGFSIDGCTDGSFNFSSEYGQPFTAWHWVFDNRPCSATFHITLPEGLSYKDGTLKMYSQRLYMVDSSEYDVKVNGQDIVVTVDNIKKEAFHPVYLADKISVTLETVLNDNAVSVNTVHASMAYNNGDGLKTVDMGNVTVYAATLRFRNVGIDGKDLSGTQYDLYHYKTVTSASGIKAQTYVKIAEGIQGNPSCTISGLGNGKYKLIQTVAPYGYKKMDSYVFNINLSGSNGVVNSVSVVDDNGSQILSPGAGEEWSSNPGSGVLTSVISHSADEKQTKEISAQVKYSYGNTVKDSYTKTITNQVQVLAVNGEISTAGVYNIYEPGYKLDRITVNGEAVDSLPEFVHENDVVVYHYTEDETQTKMLSITLKYYKNGVQSSSNTYRKSAAYFETMVDTGEIDDKSSDQEFNGYKLEKITVNGKEMDSLPGQVMENSVICFYYVVDDNQTKTLTASVQHILLDWNTGAANLQEGDTFLYRDEVKVVDSSYISASDIPIKEYNGYKIAYYYIGASKYSLTDWQKARVIDGSEVKIYYMVDITNTVTWSATIQYKLGDTIQEENVIQETAPVALFESGSSKLSTDRVSEKVYKGWKLDNITVNGQEKASLPDFLLDNDIVSYNYIPVTSNVIVQYMDEDGKSICNNMTIPGTYGQTYQTEQKTLEGYDFVSINGNKEGTFGEEDIIVTYNYRRKQMPLTVKYVDKDTGDEIADRYSSFVYYGETYETDARDISGYEPAGDNGIKCPTLSRQFFG